MDFDRLYKEFDKQCNCIYPSPDDGDHYYYDPRFVEFCDDNEIDADEFAELVKQRQGWGNSA
tara:strand:- start:405 stop:590 length:186 start_codon:yes stop_codon:yes gene_type:complete